MLNATATIDILTSISDVETATIVSGTGAAASAEDLMELMYPQLPAQSEIDPDIKLDGSQELEYLLARFEHVKQDYVGKDKVAKIDELGLVKVDGITIGNSENGTLKLTAKAADVPAIDTHGININTASGTTQVTVDDAREAPIPVLEISGKSEQGADPSPDNPQEIVSTDVTAVTVTGANLLIPQISNNSTGCKASLTEDGMVLIKGISKDSEYADLYLYGKWGNSEDYGLRGTYTISCTHNGLLKLISITNHKSTIASTSKNELTFTATDENPINGIFIRLYPNTTYDCTLKIMLNIGDTALPWEPYQFNAASIALTEPLRGIKDVRDRIMCKDGVWGVERAINQTDDTGTVPISEALEVLAVPTWTPLPADTQAALNALTAYKGRTTITVTAEGPEPDITMQYYGQPGTKTNVQSMLDSQTRKTLDNVASIDNLKTRVEDAEAPEFDASGTVEGITDKTSLLASFVTRMPLVKFMRNVVAGFKMVLYAGQIVDNCVTNNAKLPLSAAQGKALMDLYTVLNTKIGAKVAVVSFVKSSIPIAAGADFYAYIPIDIDTTDVIWAFPVLTDAPGDNCTKVNISTCVWQDKSKRIYVNGCNLASGTANISLAGVLIAIR